MLSAYPMYYNLSVVCTGSRWNRFGDSCVSGWISLFTRWNSAFLALVARSL
jgi:hypothetical protein